MSIVFKSPCIISGTIDINNLYSIRNGGFNIYVNNELKEVTNIDCSKLNSLLKIAQYISSILDTSYHIKDNQLYLYPISGTSDNFSITEASAPSNSSVSDLSRLLSLTKDTGSVVVNGSYIKLNKDNKVYLYPIISENSDEPDEDLPILVINVDQNISEDNENSSSDKINWIENNRISIYKTYYTRLNDNNFRNLVKELMDSMDHGVISTIAINNLNKTIDITNSYNGKSVRLYMDNVIIKMYRLKNSDYCDEDPDKYKYLMYYGMGVSEFNLINVPD